MPAWTRAELHVLRQNSNALKVICSQLVHTARLERRKARELQEKLTSTEARLAKCALTPYSPTADTSLSHSARASASSCAPVVL